MGSESLILHWQLEVQPAEIATPGDILPGSLCAGASSEHLQCLSIHHSRRPYFSHGASGG